jgi:tRNA-modifying protein YgfZ
MTLPAAATGAPIPSRTTLTIDPLDDADRHALAALQTGVIWCDRSDRRRFILSGPKAAEVLGGLVTNDVVRLAVGAGQLAAALTPKGKVIAVLRVVRVSDDELLVDADARSGPGFFAMIRKYINPKLAAYRDVTDSTACIGLYGAAAAQVVRTLCARCGVQAPDGLDTFAPYQVACVDAAEGRWTVMRSPDLGVTGYDLIVPIAALPPLRAALVDLPMATGAVCELARIEAGRPAWGVDLDDTTIPQEAALERLQAISFDKGCYTGQEVVARLHFRGHVNKRLVWLKGAGAHPLPSGAEVATLEGSVVGDVRSSAVRPDDQCIALAMVRREVVDGAIVRVGDVEVRVHELPPSS